MPPLLGPDDVQVWYVRPESVAAPGVADRILAVLSPDELARRVRFAFPADRQLYLAAHALVRFGLSSVEPGVPPGAWTFQPTHFGKPEVAGPEARFGLTFSLSHAAGLAVCAIARNRPVGVDAEPTDRRVDVNSLAKSLSADEEAWIAQHPVTERRAAFLSVWTLKEAYLKAVGSGLSLPLDSFSIIPDHAAGATLRFRSPGSDDPERWYLSRVAVSCSHHVAVAVGRLCPGLATVHAWSTG